MSASKPILEGTRYRMAHLTHYISESDYTKIELRGLPDGEYDIFAEPTQKEQTKPSRLDWLVEQYPDAKAELKTLRDELEDFKTKAVRNAFAEHEDAKTLLLVLQKLVGELFELRARILAPGWSPGGPSTGNPEFK